MGCNIKCFIDCRGSEIHEIEGIPVYEPIGETVDIIKDTVLIIAVEDGMQHAEIARLFKAVKKILFLPIGLNCSMEKKYLYREAYYILENSSEPILKIPIFEEGGDEDRQANN